MGKHTIYIVGTLLIIAVMSWVIYHIYADDTMEELVKIAYAILTVIISILADLILYYFAITSMFGEGIVTIRNDDIF